MRRLIGWLACALAFPLMTHAQSYPSKPIRVVSSSASSSPGDVSLRLVSRRLADALGQPVVVETRAGGNGQVAAAEVKRAAPDGHTLMFGSSGQVVGASLLQKNLAVDVAKEFAPISVLSQVTNFLVVHGAVPVANAKDLVEYAKRNPGRLSYSSNGVGSGIHLNGLAFSLSTGSELLHVPYGTGNDSQRYADFVAGRLLVAFAPYTTLKPYLAAGKVRVLATMDEQRNARLPDVPAITESFAAYKLVKGWWGLFGPAGTPQAVVSRLSDELRKAAKDPDITAKLDEIDITLVASTPQQLAETLKRQEAVVEELVKSGGL
jgi:tripartite-type tricarboxylate transporter receptor subunit TctC